MKRTDKLTLARDYIKSVLNSDEFKNGLNLEEKNKVRQFFKTGLEKIVSEANRKGFDEAHALLEGEQKQHAQDRKKKRAERGVVSNALSDFHGGVAQVGTAYASLGSWLADMVGADETAQRLAQFAKDKQYDIERTLPSAEWNESSPDSWLPSMDFVGSTALRNLPLMLATGFGSRALIGGATKLFGPLSRGASKALEIAGTGVGMSLPETYGDAVSQDAFGNVQLPENPGVAGLMALPHAAVEVGLGISPAKLADLGTKKFITKNFVEKMSRYVRRYGPGNAAKYATKQLFGAGFGEGSEEVAQGVIGIFNRNLSNKEPGQALSDSVDELMKPETLKGLYQDFVGGATTGLIYDAGRSIASRIPRKASEKVVDGDIEGATNEIDNAINSKETTIPEKQELAKQKQVLQLPYVITNATSQALKDSDFNQARAIHPFEILGYPNPYETVGTMEDYQRYQREKQGVPEAESEFPQTPIGILNELKALYPQHNNPKRQRLLDYIAKKYGRGEAISYPEGGIGEELKALDLAEVQPESLQVAEGSYETPMLPFNGSVLPGGEVVKDSPTKDFIGLKSGKPFANEKTAKAFQTKNNLQETYDITPVRGGFMLMRKASEQKPTRVQTVKLQPGRSRVDIVEQKPIRTEGRMSLAKAGDASRIEKKLTQGKPSVKSEAETNTDEATAKVLYHRSDSAVLPVLQKSFGKFGGLFASSRDAGKEYGKNLHKIKFFGKIATDKDIASALRTDNTEDFLESFFGRKLSDEEIEYAENIIKEDFIDFNVGEKLHDDLFGQASGDDFALAQKLRGQYAKKIGFHAVEISDELAGDSTLIVDGDAIKSTIKQPEPAAEQKPAAPVKQPSSNYTVEPFHGGFRVLDPEGKQYSWHMRKEAADSKAEALASKQAESIAREVVGDKLEVTTDDLNSVGQRARGAGVKHEDLFIGKGRDAKHIADEIADQNLREAPVEKINKLVERAQTALEKISDASYKRSKIGRLQGGTAGALNRDMEGLRIQGEQQKARIKRLKDELERRGAKLPTTAMPDTAKDYIAIFKAINGGEVKTIEEYKQIVNDFFADPEEKIKGLLTRKKNNLLGMLQQLSPFSAYNQRNEKKDRIAKSVYDSMRFALMIGNERGVQFNPMEKNGYENALRKKIEGYTQETLDNHLKEIEEADAFKKKALENPETLEEFQYLEKRKGIDAFSDEQKTRYSELKRQAGIEKDQAVAERTKEQAEREKAAKATISKVDGIENVDFNIVEGFHTKRNEKIFIVAVGERVDRETFKELARKARRLGGNWSKNSRYSKDPDGFNFPSKEAAENFTKLKEEGISGKEIVEKNKVSSIANAAERLDAMADSMIEKANESLNADRQTNTARRAAMAASAENEARNNLRFANTLKNIAEGFRQGKVKIIDSIRYATDLGTLTKLLKMAKHEAEKGLTYSEQEKVKYEATTDKQIDSAVYPYPRINSEWMLRLADVFQKHAGFKRDGQRLEKFAKTLEKSNGLIKSRSLIDLLNESISKFKRRYSVVADKYIFESITDRLADYNRLNRMNISNVETLRAALRELNQFMGETQKADPIVVAERKLIGKKFEGMDFFPTPPSLAQRMAEELDIQPGMKVLEPSAGKGDLADAVKAAQPEASIQVIEPVGDLQDILKLKGHEIIDRNFESFETDQKFDRIIMNPPFSKNRDIKHVRKAYDLLAPGGKLAAITSNHFTFANDKESVAFREWLDEVGGTTESLGQAFAGKDTFRQTGVNSQLVTIEKPAETSTKAEPAKTAISGQNIEAPPTLSESAEPLYSVEYLVARYTAKGLKRAGNIVKRGFELIRSGVNNFAKWARQMFNEFGQAVKKHLRNLWKELQAANKKLGRTGAISGRPVQKATQKIIELPVELPDGLKTDSISAIRDWLKENFQGKSVFNESLNAEIEFVGKGLKETVIQLAYRKNRKEKIEAHKHSLPILDKLVEQAVYENTVDDKNKGIKKDFADKIHYLSTNVKFDGDNYRVKLVVKQYGEKNNYHTHTLSDIEIKKESYAQKDGLRDYQKASAPFADSSTKNDTPSGQNVNQSTKGNEPGLIKMSDFEWIKDHKDQMRLEFIDKSTGEVKTVATLARNAKKQWEWQNTNRAFLTASSARNFVKSYVFEKMKREERKSRKYKKIEEKRLADETQKEQTAKARAERKAHRHDDYFNQETTKRKIEPEKPKTWKDKAAVFMDRVTSVLFDKWHSLKKVQDKALKAKGLNSLPDEQNAYQRLEVMTGRIQERTANFKEKYWQPILDHLNEHKITYDQFNKFLRIMHAEERNNHIDEINPEFRARGIPGSGISTQDARAAIEQYKKDGVFDTYLKAGEMYWKLNNLLLDEQVKYGLLSQEMRDSFADAYKYYTPLKSPPDQGRNLDKRTLGRRSESSDQLTYTLQAINTTFSRGEINRKNLAFFRFALSNPNEALYSIFAAKKKGFFNPRTGEVEYRFDRFSKWDDEVLHAKVNGQDIAVRIHDFELLDALKNRGDLESGFLVRQLRNINRILSAVNTAWNPEFIMTNLARDVQTAMVNASADESAKIAKSVFRNIGRAIRAGIDAK